MKFYALFALTLITWVSGDFTTTTPFFGQSYTNIGGARGLLVDAEGDLLVVSQGSSRITAVYETDNGDGTVDVVQTLIVNGNGLGLNHGIAFSDGWLYASSSTKVYRWPYTPGQRKEVTAQAETVIQGIPNGGHSTRTMVFDSQKNLYVSVGSNANIDQDSSRARIRRFSLSNSFPIEFSTGEVIIFLDIFSLI